MESSDIKQQICELFDPLAARLGLHKTPWAGSTTFTFYIGYLGTDLSIAIDVDIREFYIGVYVFRNKTGKVPLGHQAQGDNQIIPLQDALKLLGLDETRERIALRKLWKDYRNCTQVGKILVDLIERSWPLLQEQSNFLFK